MSLLGNKLAGLRDSLAFSNRWSLLLQRLLRPSEPIVTYHWRDRWWLVCDARIQDTAAPKEVLARGCYDVWISRSAREGVLSYMNVGANIGAFDIAVASNASVPFALSIELNPETFTRLNFNLTINGLKQVFTLNVGVAGESGEFQFQGSDCSLADSLYAPPAPSDGEPVRTIPLVPLDEALTRAGFASREFDLLKLDCEAAEYAIIASAPAAVLRQFRHIVIELHPVPPGESLDALWSRLESTGFRAQTLRPSTIEQTSLHFWTRLDEPLGSV